MFSWIPQMEMVNQETSQPPLRKRKNVILSQRRRICAQIEDVMTLLQTPPASADASHGSA
jgi:hypothetical protein